MKIGFIGAGKAGTSLGIHFMKNGIALSGYYSKSKNSSKQAADYTKSTAFSNLDQVVANSDMIFVTTPDGIIEQIAQILSELDISTKILCHCSGSLSSEIFSCTNGIKVSAHPMLSISSKNIDMSKAFFTLEGDVVGLEALAEIFKKTKNKTIVIKSESKIKYHCAASLASNLMIALAEKSIKMLKDCGFERKSAIELLGPLMENNIKAICENGTVGALTGPVERCDKDTVAAHLDILDEKDKEIYRLLSLELINVAREKNKERNYSSLKKLLEEVK